MTIQKITPCLWFDAQAEQAALFYTSIFPRSRMQNASRYGKEGVEVHGQPEGTVMTVEFELDGMRFTALNGGPAFRFTEAISFQVTCDTQEEVDYFWDKLSAKGDETAQQCGWLKDKFGVSWQIIPKDLGRYIGGPDPQRAGRAMQAMLQMKKLDIEKIRKAYELDDPS
jgi:predicted 3-demethylubiquinone-9 3-methyltransferase (glyoxalase superfamily)